MRLLSHLLVLGQKDNIHTWLSFGHFSSKLLGIRGWLVAWWTRIRIIKCTIAGLAVVWTTATKCSTTHVVHEVRVVLLGNTSGALGMGDPICRSIWWWSCSVVYTLDRVIVGPRISSGSRATVCREIRVPMAKRGVSVGIPGCFRRAKRRRSTATSATASTVASLVLRFTGTCRALFPFCLGFL